MSVSAMIVDDEPLARQYLRTILSRIDDVRIVAEAAEGRSCLEQAKEHQPDVVFLDIRMPKSSGMEVARALRESAKSPQVVFVTGYGEYAADAFDLEAADYITKPFDEDRVKRAVERVRVRLQSEGVPSVSVNLAASIGSVPKRVTLRTKDGLILVEPSEIYYARTNGRSTQVKTKTGVIAINTSVKELDSRLSPLGFFRANEGAVINLRYLKQVVFFRPRSHELLMGDPEGTFIPLSRSRVKKLFSLLGEPLG